ncbi:hypothetical protein A7J05_02950 [Streptomyces alfalfae]|uniref:Uncharacterized protein n=1 Tax=Streptomyces alfalfae TaxID=1642299 RepID=A0ABN4VBZ0_9ACTN|nr:hypothetical protein A7J05_02950 [Streptomyces alfalfae]
MTVPPPANEAQSAHHRLAGGGQTRSAVGLTDRTMNADEDVDPTRTHEDDLAPVDHDPGAGVSQASRARRSVVFGAVIDLPHQ